MQHLKKEALIRPLTKTFKRSHKRPLKWFCKGTFKKTPYKDHLRTPLKGLIRPFRNSFKGSL